ncbi:acetaldehyde dehydrogenase, partial [Streptococcus suis]
SFTVGCVFYCRISLSYNVSDLNLLNFMKVVSLRNIMKWFKVTSKTYYELNSIQYLQKCRDEERVIIDTELAMV